MIRNLTAVLAFCVSGCVTAVGPDRATPDIAVTRQFAFAASPDLAVAAGEHWWLLLGDPALDTLMERGLRQNLDIRTAQARIAQARARVRAVSRRQISGDVTASASATVTDDGSRQSESLQGGASYVFDLFGGELRRQQAANAGLEASLLDAASTRLGFQLELATAMIELRFFQTAAAITDRSVADRRRILSLTRELVAADQLTNVDELRARAALSVVQAEMPSLRGGIRLAAVRLATLVDMPVTQVMALVGSGAQPRPRRIPESGVPANLLRNRPDVLAAEYRLSQALAQIGVAEAALYPSLTLDGTIQVTDGGAFRLGPALSLPVLSRGRLIALRDETAAQAAEAEIAWRREVSEAVADVEAALVRIDTSQQEISAFAKASRDYAELETQSREIFQLGASTLLELTDSAQDRYRTDLDLAAARRNLAASTAQLAVATGRGWQAGPAGS